MSEAEVILACEDVAKTYIEGKSQVDILQHVNLQIHAGEQVAIVGASGSGKSTLLHILGALDTPSSGKVFIDGVDVTKYGEKKRSRLRNRRLGFVYQFHHLLPEFTALENVAMPLLLRGVRPGLAKARAVELLDRVGLQKRHRHKIGELSGGERQRVAIVRALVTEPGCVLADEPTGNLDPKTAHRVYESMLELNHELKTSFVIVTHDLELAKRMDRIMTIVDGRLDEIS